MSIIVFVLAVYGFCAVFRQILVHAFVVLRRGVDGYVARQVAGTRARHGDVTGMQDAATAATAAQRRRRRSTLLLGFWLAALLLPALTTWPQGFYALYSMLWVLPLRTLRRS